MVHDPLTSAKPRSVIGRRAGVVDAVAGCVGELTDVRGSHCDQSQFAVRSRQMDTLTPPRSVTNIAGLSGDQAPWWPGLEG